VRPGRDRGCDLGEIRVIRWQFRPQQLRRQIIDAGRPVEAEQAVLGAAIRSACEPRP
jgi:hypothetical protein